MKNKCALIVPYFGKFPDNFDVFLLTCRYNPEFKWIIFTDDHTPHIHSDNVEFHYCKFEDIKIYIQSFFEFEIKLTAPYKLCDFRPAYGQIFAKYLVGYDFWGHCDIDQYFGHLTSFIDDNLLDQYDKLFVLGHLSLYRNNDCINTLYKQSIGQKSFKEIFADQKGYGFDEWGCGKYLNINDIILKRDDVRVYSNNCYADVSPNKSSFQSCSFDYTKRTFYYEEKRIGIYLWSHGYLYYVYSHNLHIIKKEKLYVHLQKRKLDLSKKISDADIKNKGFVIIPNKIYFYDNLLTNDKIIKYYLLRALVHRMMRIDELIAFFGRIKRFGRRLNKA